MYRDEKQREREKEREERKKEREKKEKERLRWRPMYTTVNEGTRRMLGRNMPLRYRETNLRSNMHRKAQLGGACVGRNLIRENMGLEK